MQPQSEINSKCKFKNQQLPATPTTRNTKTTSSGSILQQSPTTTAAATATAHENTKRSFAVKVVKCKKPLCHFKFYLDIRDHQLTKRIEEQIKLLGGSLEFFLTPNVTHFVTDKPIVPSTTATSESNTNNSNNPNTSCPVTPQTPQTPQTPKTPYSLECLPDTNKPNNGLVTKKPIRNSRADAILNRARRQSTINVSTPTTSHHQSKILAAEETSHATPLKYKKTLDNNDTGTTQLPYVVWQCEIALRFFKKVQHELKDYLNHSNKSNSRSYAVEPINLRGGFVKFESLKHNYRPYYHLFRKPQEWPKIQLSREDGAFRLSPKKELPLKEVEEVDKIPQLLDGGAFVDNMTRKSRTKSSQNHHTNLKNKGNDLIKSPVESQKQSPKCKNQTPQHQKDSSDKQCGVCEICKIEYDALTLHLKTKDHEYFAKNPQNFVALDSLIHSSADVSKFLDENRKLEIKTELEEMEVDHEDLTVIEQDPLQNSENENEIENENENENDGDENENEDDEDDDDESQKSSSTNKRKSVEPKTLSPTLREKSKRSTKGKHSSEKFQNCTLITTAKTPKTSSPQKSLAALNIKTSLTRRKQSSANVVSPPIRAMLPPNSLYKVVETHTAEVNGTPPRGRGLAAGLNDDAKAMGSPIIVKFKKVRTTELQVLNGEAESFMFPKKRSDSSELPTDIDRQTTSDRVQQAHSSQQILSSSSDEQDPDDDFDHKNNQINVIQSDKRAVVKANRRLSKACCSSTSKTKSKGEIKQSFPKTPIQPNEQLKAESKSTTAKRKSATGSQNNSAKAQTVTNMSVSNKILLPEATRKSSRTATAIVTAATTSTRLLQAAVEAAKTKQKLATSAKSKLLPPPPAAAQYQTPKKLRIKQEPKDDYENGEEDNFNAGNNELSRTGCISKNLRCRRRSVVKLEDRMGDTNKKYQNSLSKRKLIYGFDADDFEDDDITFDGEYDDDEKDEDFIVQSSKCKARLSTLSTKKPANKTSSTDMDEQVTETTLGTLPNGKPSRKTTSQPNVSMREERLARRQSRIITQLQLELQTGSEEELMKDTPKLKVVEKKPTKAPVGKTPSKSVLKLSKPANTPKKTPVKSTSSTKHACATPSRYFDYNKSERLKSMCYAFERIPTADLWYRVYKRQDNSEEKYFEYFGSTKYRKLPYELGPITFDSTLLDHKKHSMCCKLCESGRLRKESNKTQKSLRNNLESDVKQEPCESQSNSNSLESQEDNNYPSTSSQLRLQQEEQHNVINDQSQEHSKLNCTSHTVDTKSYVHKHKKLHLLQRYRQELEQQELMQRQKLEEQLKNSCLVTGNSEIKMEDITQDSLPSRNDRAESIHSNASSCASSTHTNCKSRKMRHKLLNKVSFLANLELPPRKSPREHASTLALVSCIIKQRQDSLSKPNSETDEPPTTPTETESKILAMAEQHLSTCELLDKEPPKTPPPSAHKPSVDHRSPNVVSSPRTRSQAATPVEELRFATEISETVKRMRRGRNKYDYSPPFVQRMVGRSATGRGRGRGGSNSVVNLFGKASKVTTSVASLGPTSNEVVSRTTNINSQAHTSVTGVTRGRRRRGRPKGYNNIQKNAVNVLTSIRKTGSKKGVLEFDVDNVAIEALKKATTDYINPRLLEWQIDKFLTFSNKEYEKNLLMSPVNVTTPPEDDIQELGDDELMKNPLHDNTTAESTTSDINHVALITPPATDYFSSDFDLCDIINQISERLDEQGVDANCIDRRSNKFSIFNSVHLNKYYRKRKNPKTNRTGWPKNPKKKAVTRQQSSKDKIYFLQNGNVREENYENEVAIKKEVIDDSIGVEEDETTQEQTRESGVITPPYSENEVGDGENQHKIMNEDDEESLLIEEDSRVELNEDSQTANDDDDDDNDDDDDDDDEEEEEDEFEDCERVIEEDDETIADSIEEENEQKADSDADADIEEVDEEEESNLAQQKCLEFSKKLNKKSKKSIPKIFENDDEDSYEPQEKRSRTVQVSPIEKLRTSLLNPNSARTSTPTTPFMRALRRTPQLNGSLGSCISPSEKAGDNSDIFTVSSDGLETDMDLSNSHSQLRSTTNLAIDDDEPHHHHHHYHNTSLHNNNSNSTTTPRRKFDISKYAPTNAVTCAAEAATAAVKSLAISQFLKKEVRVTCRRLRAPFRRFRYRR